MTDDEMLRLAVARRSAAALERLADTTEKILAIVQAGESRIAKMEADARRWTEDGGDSVAGRRGRE